MRKSCLLFYPNSVTAIQNKIVGLLPLKWHKFQERWCMFQLSTLRNQLLLFMMAHDFNSTRVSTKLVHYVTTVLPHPVLHQAQHPIGSPPTTVSEYGTECLFIVPKTKIFPRKGILGNVKRSQKVWCYQESFQMCYIWSDFIPPIFRWSMWLK